MKKLKVMTVFGTRPEAIKMAPLALELKKYDNIESIVCVTAQHRQMLDQVLEIFGITPDYDLDIMKTRQSLIGITTRVLEGLDEVIKKEQPDIVLVHGDTSTSFVAALAAFYNQVKRLNFLFLNVPCSIISILFWYSTSVYQPPNVYPFLVPGAARVIASVSTV